MSIKSTPVLHTLALLAVLLWGLNFISIKLLYSEGLGPFAVVTLKIALAWLIMAVVSPKWFFADNPHHELMFALLGLLFVPLYHGLEALALTSAQAGTIAAVMACAPLMTAFTTLFARRWLRIHWTMWCGITVAMTGVALVVIDSDILNGLNAASGCLLALGSCISWALYAMFLRSFAGYPPSFILRKSMGYGLLFVLPFAYMEGTLSVSTLTQPMVIGNLLFLSVGVMVIASMIWFYLVHEVGSEAISTWLYLVPLVAIIGGMYALHEQMSFIGFMGTMMILCGVWAGQFGAKRISAHFANMDALPSH